jgi:hypothetical protein
MAFPVSPNISSSSKLFRISGYGGALIVGIHSAAFPAPPLYPIPYGKARGGIADFDTLFLSA